MSRIFVTGDTHTPHHIHKLNKTNFPVGQTLTQEDIVIICGDAGFVWDVGPKDDEWIDWISQQPWTTVFVDGNHEDHISLKKYPVVEFHGAKAHQISDSLYHIMRGEIMTINNQTFFCFGGAFSHDRAFRTEGWDWFQEELPVQEEVDNALDNLTKYNNQVDYIITHDVSTYDNYRLGYYGSRMGNYDSKYINIHSFLENIRQTVSYKDWFAGHYHIDKKIENTQMLFNTIIEILEDGSFRTYDKAQKLYEKHFTEEELYDLCKKYNLYIYKTKFVTFDELKDYPPCLPVINLFDNQGRLDGQWLYKMQSMMQEFLVSKDTK